MRWFKRELDGKQVSVWAVKAQGKLWIHFAGQTHVLESSLNGARRGTNPSSSVASGLCKAPMPGKVTKVFVKAGEKVSVGQSLVVMEAMKMEYTLEADLAGLVAEIGAHEGDQVALGQLLVRVNP